MAKTAKTTQKETKVVTPVPTVTPVVEKLPTVAPVQVTEPKKVKELEPMSRADLLAYHLERLDDSVDKAAVLPFFNSFLRDDVLESERRAQVIARVNALDASHVTRGRIQNLFEDIFGK